MKASLLISSPSAYPVDPELGGTNRCYLVYGIKPLPNELVRIVRTTLNGLPITYNGISLKQYCARLKIPYETVRTRVARWEPGTYADWFRRVISDVRLDSKGVRFLVVRPDDPIEIKRAVWRAKKRARGMKLLAGEIDARVANNPPDLPPSDVVKTQRARWAADKRRTRAKFKIRNPAKEPQPTG